MVLLLADDRKDIVQGIAHAVDWAARDVTVLCAYNGQEALRLIETNSVDLVITDICMPLMDGLELVRRAVQVAPQIRFVILTAYEEFSYAREAIRLGVVEYLTKPVRLEEIEKLVEKNQRRLQQERQEQQEKEKTHAPGAEHAAGFAGAIFSGAAGSSPTGECRDTAEI